MSGTKAKILAVDDDSIWLEQVPFILEDDCEVDCVSSIDAALASVERCSYDLVLLDLNFESEARSGLDVFRAVQALDRGADVIVISGETQPSRLIEVFNAGVSRFIPKPATPDQIRKEVQSVLDQRELRRRSLCGLSQNSAGRVMSPLVGKSSAILRLREEVERILRGGVKDLLVQGETGTGKEVLARFLADRLDRSGRFIPIHCGALADGLVESELFGHTKGAFTGADRDRMGAFEAAGGGIVFLDEIGEMPLAQQAKLLRVLQDRTVQRVGSFNEIKVAFRSISATNVNLDEAVAEKRFREDLFYRIAKQRVVMPPLRDRLDDMPELVQGMLDSGGGAALKVITRDAMRLLQGYGWPGNLRQLRAVCDNLVVVADGPVIREKEIFSVLPEMAPRPGPGLTRTLNGPFTKTILEAEKNKFLKALALADGDRAAAAKVLGLSRATYYRRAKELGLVQRRSLGGN